MVKNPWLHCLSHIATFTKRVYIRLKNKTTIYLGFSGGSDGKKKITCNAGDPDLIPGLGRFPGEEIGYPLQHLWASLAAQTVKNPPAVWETWVQSFSWEDPLEEGMANHSSTLAWRISWTEKPGRLQSLRSQSQTRLK